ncbi:MAG TPA: biopolymer transporter ExbD [Abditibacterium sp.]
MKIRRVEPKKARIEIIPMIDAIFFLLVFFMMTSLQMVQLNSEKVDLPQSKSPAVQPTQKIVVSLDKNGALFLERDKIEAGKLVAALAPRISEKPDSVVILNIDKNQPMSGFTRIFDLVKQANPAKVMIAATPKNPDQLPASDRP